MKADILPEHLKQEARKPGKLHEPGRILCECTAGKARRSAQGNPAGGMMMILRRKPGNYTEQE
jgi:hypothetical protein